MTDIDAERARVRKLTIEELVAEVRAAGGSACTIGAELGDGTPFSLFLAIGHTPGGLFAMELVGFAESELARRSSEWSKERDS